MIEIDSVLCLVKPQVCKTLTPAKLVGQHVIRSGKHDAARGDDFAMM
jgi:hypothetical protein